MAEKAIAVIAQDDDDRMIEVVRVDDSYAEIRTLCYGHGVGWYSQGVVQVDLSSVQPLIRSLLESASGTGLGKAGEQAAGNVVALPVGRQRRIPSRRRHQRTGT